MDALKVKIYSPVYVYMLFMPLFSFSFVSFGALWHLILILHVHKLSDIALVGGFKSEF